MIDSSRSPPRTREISLAALPTSKDTKTTDPTRRRAVSEVPKSNFQQTEIKSTPNENTVKKSSDASTNNTSANNKPAETPQVHENTVCDCINEHYPTTVMDQVYGGTLESIYNLLYHSGFMKKFLLENQKSEGKKDREQVIFI